MLLPGGGSPSRLAMGLDDARALTGYPAKIFKDRPWRVMAAFDGGEAPRATAPESAPDLWAVDLADAPDERPVTGARSARATPACASLVSPPTRSGLTPARCGRPTSDGPDQAVRPGRAARRRRSGIGSTPWEGRPAKTRWKKTGSIEGARHPSAEPARPDGLGRPFLGGGAGSTKPGNFGRPISHAPVFSRLG